MTDDQIKSLLYQFAGYLTTKEESITVGAEHDTAVIADAVEAFVETQDISEYQQKDDKFYQLCVEAQQMFSDVAVHLPNQEKYQLWLTRFASYELPLPSTQLLEEAARIMDAIVTGTVISDTVFVDLASEARLCLDSYEHGEAPFDYISEAIKTEATDFEGMFKRLGLVTVFDYFVENKPLRQLHAGVGLATEAGELLDALKAHIFYGKDLDTQNLFEEVGDLFWYLALFCHANGWTFEEVQKANIKKLQDKKKGRYKSGKFTAEEAINRDTEEEMEALTGNSDTVN